MLDLIAPFVKFAVARITSIGAIIDIPKVTESIRSDFGYIDIPDTVIIKVLSRDKEHFRKNNNNYYLEASLDEQVERFESRKTECISKIDYIGEHLFDYLIMHCKKSKITSKDQCIELLNNFFAIFALRIGLESLEQEVISYKQDEVNYYIAQYIFEKKEQNSIEYETILELTKGYLLRSAIYLQIDNTDLTKASYKNTAFYYDTPFLLQLLGYQSEREADLANALHDSLKRQGAKFYYFPQTEKEIISILTAYQYSLSGRTRSSRTLEGLDIQRYQSEDVNRLILTFPVTLNKHFGVELCELPSYAHTNLGTVDVNSVDVNETDAIEYVRQHTKHYTEDNLESDVASALGIHRLRSGVVSQSIERCKALFVTTNVDFTRAFNEYYGKSVSRNGIMPVITAFDLSAIAWVKTGSIASEIPERQLLTNAYLAMQPAPEIMERCKSILAQLESEGIITEAEAISLRTDRVTQKELWADFFPPVDSIDKNYIKMLQERQRKKIIKEAKEELVDQHKRESEQKEQDRKNEAHRKAMKIARQKRTTVLKVWKGILFLLFFAVAIGCLIGLFKTIASLEKSICLAAFLIVSALSICDTLSTRSKLIGKWLEKKANIYQTKVFEKQKQDYLDILGKD